MSDAAKQIDYGALRPESRPGGAFGAASDADGVHFTLFSRNARRISLVLFDDPEAAAPVREIPLNPKTHREGDVWSIYLRGLPQGALYLYRAEGPHAKNSGHAYARDALLLDPYALAFAGPVDAHVPKCVVVPRPEPRAVPRSRTPIADSVIYEMHVRGFTAHSSSGATEPGTYQAAIEKIPHLVELGVTAVELLPVHEPGEYETGRKNPHTGEKLVNYWGYSPIGFFAANRRYAGGTDGVAAMTAFQDMVTAFHQAGIEVFVDVVYNHTSEKLDKPAQSFRGLDNRVYYHVDENGKYRDYTGCGNSLSCSHPIMRDLAVASLRYWARVMGVDGFRFDLAPVLKRGTDGRLLDPAPLIEDITDDPYLRDVKLIAEPWDLGGGYQVGHFGPQRWAEWNGRYRDDVRRFWRGDSQAKGDFARRLTGSPDLYQDGGRSPQHSINFVTAHDGFTLRDLVSYTHKQNLANGEENRDGLDENLSANCGVEGDTNDPEILALRRRMQKNFAATLFLSLGVPMMLGGDEMNRTQGGNNNAYCQDNETSWFDWSALERDRDLFEFYKGIIAFRKANAVFRRVTYFTGAPDKGADHPDLLWFKADGADQIWDVEDLTLACQINGSENHGVWVYLMFNPTNEAVSFKTPRGNWRVRIDTSEPTGRDVRTADQAARLHTRTVLLPPKTLMALTDERV